jgi:hypothetical protein
MGYRAGTSEEDGTRIVIVDDHGLLGQSLTFALGADGWEVEQCTDLTAEGILPPMFSRHRSDPTGDVFPIRLYLTNVSWRIGTDDDAEITSEEIVTQWSAFPVLSIETASRPPGFRVTYQAAGQRWVSSATVRRDGRAYEVEGRSESFDDEYRPVAGSLRFGPDFTDLEEDLPLSASVDVRVAIGEMEIDLN